MHSSSSSSGGGGGSIYNMNMHICVQKCRDSSTDPGGSASQQTLNDVMMSARLKEVDLTCQVNEFKEKLLITEQQVTVSVVCISLLLLRGFIERRIAQRPQVRYVSSGIVNCSHVNRQHTINS